MDYIFNPASLSTPGDRKSKSEERERAGRGSKAPSSSTPGCLLLRGASSSTGSDARLSLRVSRRFFSSPRTSSVARAAPPLTLSLLELAFSPLPAARRDPASGAAPRRILYFRIPDGITMQEISFVIYARERASAPLQTSTFSLRLIKLPGGLCILNRRPACHLYASRALPPSPLPLSIHYYLGRVFLSFFPRTSASRFSIRRVFAL